MKYWFSLAKKGNAIASAIIEAALVEAIERRADSAFGKSRTEEERNIRFKARMEGKETRRSLTDAIKSYIDRTPNLSENTLKFLYSNVTDATYRALFGRSCKVLTKDLQAELGKLRDSLMPKELNHLNAFEDLAMRLIDDHQYTPMDAIKEAENRLLIKQHDRSANIQ